MKTQLVAAGAPALPSPAARIGLVALTLAAVVAPLGPGNLPRWLADLCTASGPPLPWTASVDAAGAERPATVIQPLSCEALPHVPGKSVTTALVHFPAGAYTGPHRHPGSVTAYVISGTIRSQMAGGPAVKYGPGQTWFEAPQALHLFAENASRTTPARLLVTFVADTNCGPLVIPEPPGASAR